MSILKNGSLLKTTCHLARLPLYSVKSEVLNSFLTHLYSILIINIINLKLFTHIEEINGYAGVIYDPFTSTKFQSSLDHKYLHKDVEINQCRCQKDSSVPISHLQM